MTDFTVIGGGIVGLATAHALLEGGAVSVRILEKEAGTARHQSTHNSGVLHAGLQYAPGSLKARLAREGIRRMTAFCQDHDVPHEICGKLVVARHEGERPYLDDMLARGRANGLEGLRTLSAEEAREVEPHVRAVAALLVPEEGIVDYGAVCRALAGDVVKAGGEIVTGAEVTDLRRDGVWRIGSTAGDFSSRVIVNCAGLYSDRIVALAGGRPTCRIVPFRGEYYRLVPERAHLVRHLIYPLPEPGFPFLGVHFTRRVGGGIDAGPNAVLAFAREGYTLTTVDAAELVDALSYQGLWRFLFRHPRMVARELAWSLSKSRFVEALQSLVPDVTGGDLVPARAGVRAQAMSRRGDLIHDFVWDEGPGVVHVVNAPSPAATASLAIGRVVAARAFDRLRH